MTVQTKNQLRVLFWTVLAGMLLIMAPKAADQVIFRPEFKSHEMRLENKIDRVLDAVCEKEPNLRACK